MLDVRPAQPNETDAVLDFYHYIIDAMAGTDYDVLWNRNTHPTDESLMNAINQGWLMCGWTEDGKLVSALVLDHKPARGYEKVTWDVTEPDELIGVLHSVATDPQYHGQGFAKQVIAATIDRARAEGMVALHLDTFTTNVRGNALYAACGFTSKGVHTIFYDDLGSVDHALYEYVL